MPNNRQIAHQRAQHLIKTYEKDQTFFNEFKAIMNEAMGREEPA